MNEKVEESNQMDGCEQQRCLSQVTLNSKDSIFYSIPSSPVSTPSETPNEVKKSRKIHPVGMAFPNIALVPCNEIGVSKYQNRKYQTSKELDGQERFQYTLNKQQIKASSRVSALLTGFAMVVLVEFQFEDTTPHFLLVLLSIATILTISVHLIALMISTCLLPYIESSGCSEDSPHKRLAFYINLAWIFSTCLGLILFIILIAIIAFIKFENVSYLPAAYVAGGILIPVFISFILISCLIHRDRTNHSIERAENKMASFKNKYINKMDLESGIHHCEDIITEADLNELKKKKRQQN
uniref:MARVEL domain-containing protein n=1 Tax=Parastrongyloides trichosuri TaxID=131310 RepID=A0A0N4ZIS7_PARTI